MCIIMPRIVMPRFGVQSFPTIKLFFGTVEEEKYEVPRGMQCNVRGTPGYAVQCTRYPGVYSSMLPMFARGEDIYLVSSIHRPARAFVRHRIGCSNKSLHTRQ